MQKINFTKMVASGNDFVVVEVKSQKSKVKSLNNLARKICDRKYGIGADGLLILEKSKIANVRMRIFNADGSEAQMCGNGARCIALWVSSKLKAQSSKLKIETKAGVIESKVQGDNVKIKLTDPKNLKMNIPLTVNNRILRVNFVDTGVPHAVIFVEGLKRIDAVNIGRQIRYHGRFKPAGTNVDFVEILNHNSIKIRTYERGVEDETLACGTGAVASSLITSHKDILRSAKDTSPKDTEQKRSAETQGHKKIDIYTKGKEVLKVYFDKINNRFQNVWLEGKARIVYEGVYHV